MRGPSHAVRERQQRRGSSIFVASDHPVSRTDKHDGGVMTRALVIGGTLFIGRTLVEQLLERGDDVVVMHRGKGTPFGSRVGEIRCDRNDSAAVRAALSDASVDVVYDNVYDWERG